MASMLVFCLAGRPALADFGVITPSDDIVTQRESKDIELEAKFTHPNKLYYMENGVLPIHYP